MNSINENFINLYKRWKSGSYRTEDFMSKITETMGRCNISSKLYDIDNKNKCVNFKSSIDINDDFLDNGEIPFKIGNVNGNFDISSTRLKSLKNAPNSVLGYFNISSTSVSSLIGSPETITGDFFATDIYITSLEGMPKKIGGDVYITTWAADENDKRIVFKKDDIPEGTEIDGTVRFQIRKNRF